MNARTFGIIMIPSSASFPAKPFQLFLPQPSSVNAADQIFDSTAVNYIFPLAADNPNSSKGQPGQKAEYLFENLHGEQLPRGARNILLTHSSGCQSLENISRIYAL